MVQSKQSMSIKDLFPWSAEARMISFLLKQRKEREMDDFYFASEISEGAEINVRTIRAKMPRLAELGIIKVGRVYDEMNRTQNGFKLIDSKLTEALVELEKVLEGDEE